MEEVTTEIIEEGGEVVNHTFDWLINLFYYEGDLLKTFLSFFGFMFILLVVFEMLHIIVGGMKTFRSI